MLVLGRKVSEQILITSPNGTRLDLMVVEVRGDKVRIGINAPRDWTIHRREVQEKIDSMPDGQV